MDALKNNQNITNNHSKPEVIGIHANAILTRGMADANELNKRMDALCMDPEICEAILGEEVYEISKSKLTTSKPFLDIQDHDTIKNLPEFQEFLRKYQLEKERKETIDLQTEELTAKKNLLKEMDLPPDIQSKKNEIDEVKKTTLELLDDKQEKNIGNNKTFLELIKKSGLEERQRQEKGNIIYDFIFQYMESNSNKSKRRTGESSTLFYERIGVDYFINNVKETIKSQENKINDQIKKRKEKKGQKISINKKIDLPKNDYTEEALKIFISALPKNKDIRSKFYLPEDQKDISHIQSYFKTHLLGTIKSPNINNFIKTSNTQENTLERDGEKIKIHNNDYREMKRRQTVFKGNFENGYRNPREYLFDRLVEYVGQDILSYEVDQSIKRRKKYRGTTFEIKKTDRLDDSSAGADYIIIYKFRNNIVRKMAAIDLYISEKEEKIKEVHDYTHQDKNTLNKESSADLTPYMSDEKEKAEADPDYIHRENNTTPLEEKLLKAKKPKIPYSSYIQLFQSTKVESYKMKPIRRYVEKQDPTMVYTILNAIIKDKKLNIGSLLEEFKNKGNIYGSIKDKGGNKSIITINKHLDHDIIGELEQTAA